MSDASRKIAQNLKDALKTQSLTVPVFDRKVSVTTSHTGWKASIGVKELGEYLAQHYLGTVVPASALPEFMNRFVKVDLKTKAVIKANYVKPKREGGRGMVLSMLDNLSPSGPAGVTPISAGRMVEAISDSLEQHKPGGAVRAYTFKIVGDLTVVPKSAYVPIKGHLKVGVELCYVEYANRIELHFGDITVVGGLQYHVDIEHTHKYLTWHDPFGMAEDMPRGGTKVEGPRLLVGKEHEDVYKLKGTSKIKSLTYKQTFSPATLVLYPSGMLAGLVSDIPREQFEMMMWMLIMWICLQEPT